MQLDSAEKAEAAFYAAMKNGDPDAMAAVWWRAADVACVHPGGPRLLGFDQVLQSWRDILGNSGGLRISFELLHHHTDDRMSVRFLNETVAPDNDPEDVIMVLTTNAYRKTESGWRMVLHHASPAPRSGGAAAEAHPEYPDADDDPGITLH